MEVNGSPYKLIIIIMDAFIERQSPAKTGRGEGGREGGREGGEGGRGGMNVIHILMGHNI